MFDGNSGQRSRCVGITVVRSVYWTSRLSANSSSCNDSAKLVHVDTRASVTKQCNFWCERVVILFRLGGSKDTAGLALY